MNITRKLLLTALASTGLAVSSYAGAVLYLADGSGHTMTINDNVGFDTSPTTGVITWSGSFGDWTVNLSATGVTAGTAAMPDLDLSISASTTNATGGYLIAYYADTDFGPTTGTLSASIGGTLKGTGSSADFASYYYAGNNVQPPGYYTTMLTNHSFTGAAFSGTDNVGFSATGPYGLYDVVALTQTTAGTSSYDANVSVIPDSVSTGLMIGLGMLCLGFAARRKVA